MSRAAMPSLAPLPKGPATPEIVHGSPKKPNRRGLWLLLFVCIVAGALWWFWPQLSSQPATRSVAPVGIRTAAVTQGAIARTLRLTGTTGAERFASLLVPRMRGSRSEALRDARNFQGPGTNYTVQSNATTGGSNVGASMSSSGTVASSAGSSTRGGSSAMQAATSRVRSGGSSRSSASSSSSSSSSSSGSSSSGSGLGSTAGSLLSMGGGGGGGGGGGRGDYSMVLQSAVEPGATVRKDDVVAEFDRQNMLLRLEDYRASVAQMEASFEKLKAEVDVQRKTHNLTIGNAKADLEKAQLDVKTIPVLGAIDAERTRLTAEEAAARYKQLLSEVKYIEASAASQIRTADLQLQQARLELKRAEMNADRMLLKAPINGLVVMQTIWRSGEMAQIRVGDQLYPGMRFMQIVDPSSMVVNASVNQVDAEALRIGAKAKVQFDAFPGLELKAHVHAIGAMTRPGGMRASFVKEIPVVLKMDEMDPRVIPDLSVSVDVEIEQETQAAAIAPLAAVFHDSASQSPFVFVRKGNAWERREVELGVANHLSVAVRSGLQPGEQVALEYPPVEGRNKGRS